MGQIADRILKEIQNDKSGSPEVVSGKIELAIKKLYVSKKSIAKIGRGLIGELDKRAKKDGAYELLILEKIDGVKELLCRLAKG